MTLNASKFVSGAQLIVITKFWKVAGRLEVLCHEGIMRI